jgi:TPR repeat protein
MRAIFVIISLFLTACATENQESALNDRGFDVVSSNVNSKDRVALVIGNNDYQKPFSSLNNTINDAKAMKNILETRGFKVIYKTNVTKREFDESLEKFYQETRRGSMGLLYFSGHGFESNGDNYLIPIDAKIKAKSDIQYEAIALNKVTARMQSEYFYGKDGLQKSKSKAREFYKKACDLNYAKGCTYFATY